MLFLQLYNLTTKAFCWHAAIVEINLMQEYNVHLSALKPKGEVVVFFYFMLMINIEAFTKIYI